MGRAYRSKHSNAFRLANWSLVLFTSGANNDTLWLGSPVLLFPARPPTRPSASTPAKRDVRAVFSLLSSASHDVFWLPASLAIDR